MLNSEENNKRIAKNTVYLYVRMFITMIVALYTSRIVLRVLGISDYGLYNVIGGIVTMFSMFSATMSTGTQRFLNFAMGAHNDLITKTTFSIALCIHIFLSIFLLVLAETVGLWFLNTQMNVPCGRETATFWVYQFSVAAFVVNVIQVPFNSCIIAHEKMDVYACMSIYDVVMKLLIVLLIQIASYDKLIFYAFMILAVNLSSMVIYNIYCHIHFRECAWRLMWEKKLAMKIITFSGWNIFGSSVGFATGQGINILLNIFCGTYINAARGLSITVSQYVGQFVSNFQTAVNPQLIKMYAAKEYEQMYRLTINSCRINGYLLLMVAIPAAIEIKYLLTIWLGKYPQYTDLFVQIILIQTFLYTMDRPLITHVHASGKMKWPNLTDGIALLMVLPISYFILKLGYGPIPVIWANSLIWIVDNISAIYWSHKYTRIPIKLILTQIYGNVFLGGFVMIIIPLFVSSLFHEGIARFLVVCIISIISSTMVIYIWGMTPGMKSILWKKIHFNK